MRHLILFALMPILSLGQVQIGQDINGETFNTDDGDFLGHSVAMSSNGNIIAVGAPSFYNYSMPGYVSIYEYNAGLWNQIGNRIEGKNSFNYGFGESISLSSDGSIIAIGSAHESPGYVQIYENVSETWTQIGEDILDYESGGGFGYKVSLSADGQTVAVSKPSTYPDYAGKVMIFNNISGIWTQIGQDINGIIDGYGSGASISLSSDGSVVAIGAPKFFESASWLELANVRIFKNVNNIWTQIGNDLTGSVIGEQFGWSVSLSANGDIVAIGSTAKHNQGFFSDRVSVYKNDNDEWIQIGEDIQANNENDVTGYSVSLSSDGNIVALGILNYNNGAGSNYVKIFENLNNNWIQLGNDIIGKQFNGGFGFSVGLSSNGTKAIIGAPYNNENGTDSGLVQIYDVSEVLSTESLENDYFLIYPNPAKDVLNIRLKDGAELKKVNIYNIQSQYLYSVKTKKVVTKNLKSGVYFVEIETDKGKSTKKIIIY